MNQIKCTFASIFVSTLIIVLAAAGPALAGAREATSSWAAEPFKVDGSLAEWKNMPTTFFEDERLMLGVSNDSSRIYLFLRSDNIDFIRAMRMSGLDIWLDAKGKKSKDLCFHYRGGPSRLELKDHGLVDTTQMDSRSGLAERQPPPWMNDERHDNFTVTDKKLEFEQEVPLDSTQGPAAAYAYDHGYYVFEFSFPLQAHLVDFYGFDARPDQKVGIGIRYGGRPDRGMREGGPPEGMGGGGFPVGGRDDRSGGIGGGRPGGMGERPSLMSGIKEKELWVKTSLADMMAAGQ
jgi:hypothetical protein